MKAPTRAQRESAPIARDPRAIATVIHAPARLRAGALAVLLAVGIVSIPFASEPTWVRASAVTTGTVRAWGANWYGQLGNGLATSGHFNRPCPPTEPNIVGGCFIGSELGANGPNPDPAPGPLPTPVIDTRSTPPSALSGITAVAAGYGHSLGLQTGGTVVGWGSNGAGQLGNGTQLDHTTPVPVSSLTGVTAIAAGSAFSLALESDGTVWGWGSNSSGQLGDGTTTDRSTPVQVIGVGGTGTLGSVTAIAAGASHALALKSDGTVVAWGSNSNGQLGDGTTVDRHAPVAFGTLTGIVGVTGGGGFSLAVKSGSTAASDQVWGSGVNNLGQLGDGTTTDRSSPVQVLQSPGGSGYLGVTMVAAGGSHAVGLKSDGTVVAWGWNGDGQLGDGVGSGGTPVNSTTPVSVNGLAGMTRVAAGSVHSLALGAHGAVMAWGSNQYGQVGGAGAGSRLSGDLTHTYQPTPVTVVGVTGQMVMSIAAGGAHSLATVA